MKDPVEYQGALGHVIRERREKLGYSSQKLARIIGADVDFITAVEEGSRDLGLSEMLILARALGIPLSTLLAVAESVLPDV